jgi:hypothetical protein
MSHPIDRRRFMLAMLAAQFALPRAVAAPQPARLPPWTPGQLDIHHIATGRGNATLVIMPDGTSLLLGNRRHNYTAVLTLLRMAPSNIFGA